MLCVDRLTYRQPLFAGSTSLPEDTAPFVAGGLAVFLLTIVLLATGGLGAGKISLPSPPNPTEVVSSAQQ